MQKSGEWLTVKQFAERAGVSTQAVYKQIANRLQHSCKEENGRRFIHSDALQFFTGAEGLQPNGPEVDNRVQPLPTAETEQLRQELEQLNAKLRRTEADLTATREQRDAAERKAAAADAERKRADAAEAQLVVKDQQLAALTTALQTAQQQASDLTAALAAAQALQAGQIQLAMKSGERTAADTGTDADDQSDSSDAAAVRVPDAQAGTDASDQDGEQKKPGFFARLFGRK